MWKVKKFDVIMIATGALGAVKNNFERCLETRIGSNGRDILNDHVYLERRKEYGKYSI